MEHPHHRLAYTGIVAAVVLAIGLFALRVPVFLDDYDQWGWQINCGNGYVANLTQAEESVNDRDHVEECQTAVLTRRLWTVPLVLLGGTVLLAVLVASAITSGRESLMPRGGVS